MAAIKSREALAGAGYRIHQSIHVGRCGKCFYAAPGRKQHGRTCTKLHAAVVTHGCCTHYVSLTSGPPATSHSTVEISVRLTAGAHCTNTVQGKRASSTSSAEEAARVLCRKLFGSDAYTLLKTHVEPGRDVFSAIRDRA